MRHRECFGHTWKKARLSLAGDNRLMIVMPDALGQILLAEKIDGRNWKV